MVQAAYLDLHVGLSEKCRLNLHLWLPVAKYKVESTPKLCVSIREVEQLRLLVYAFLKIIIIIGSTAIGGPWPPQTNVASDLYSGHPPANFYNTVSLLRGLSSRANHTDRAAAAGRRS
jgi:hypothetical protein